jgi:diaminopimelate decarboxylase
VAFAVKSGIWLFNVESPAELELLNRVACRFDRIQDVAIRINPDVSAATHPYTTTGLKENKFGMDLNTAYKTFVESYRYPFLRFSGIHLHIGSQITVATPFIQAIEKAAELVLRLRSAGIFVDTLNIGGGLGIIYSDEKPQTAAAFARAVKPILARTNLKVILEPGRFIAGNSGVLVTKVLFWKTAREKTFAVVDAGMNDLIRPALYNAFHQILPVIRHKRATGEEGRKVDVVGPVCESGDFLGKERHFGPLEPGELLAVLSCGAYGYTMSSNYNSRPRLPEVVVKGRRFFIAKRRESYEDLIRGEKILDV